MDREKFLQLLDRYLTGKASDLEIRKLMAYYDSYADDEGKIPQVGSKEFVLDQLYSKISRNSKKQKLRISTAVAASIILIISFFVGLKSQFFDPELEMVSISGEQIDLVLPDGSHVKLNANTKIRYSKFFEGEMREVYLDGEAFFDVKSDPKKPFIVHTRDVDLKVLGTSFNVRAYHQEDYTETSLITGKVEVLDKTQDQLNLVLEPNQKYTSRLKKFSNTQKNISNKDLDKPKTLIEEISMNPNEELPKEVQWVHNKLGFDNESLLNISKRLAIHYNVDFVFENKKAEQYLFTATFENDELQSILNALSVVESFKFRKEGQRIIVY